MKSFFASLRLRVFAFSFSRQTLKLVGVLVAPILAFVFFVPVVEFSDPLGTAVLDRDGRLLGAVTASDGQWRFGPSSEIPDTYRTALLEFEDHRFPMHPGVDPAALIRAAVQSLAAGEIVSGGSTITMQVVRLSRHGQPRTFREKAVECLLALRLELSRSKNEILGLYAGYAPFGGNTVGLDAAAWRYFRRRPQDLSWAEAATLAVLPNAPSLIHPGRRQERLFERRNALLARLHRRGTFDALTLELAQAEPLPPSPAPMPQMAPHLLSRIRREAPDGGITTTTIDGPLQRRVGGICDRHHRRLEENHIKHLAALIVETDSGRVLAYIGNVGKPSETGAQVDIITAPRSSGSILKPFLYAAMLQSGEILPDELVADIPTRIAGFAPRNFDHQFSGAVPASVALSRSLNVPAVRMLRSHGVGRFAALLKNLGVSTLFRQPDDYGLSLILGGAEVTLWESTALYAGLGRTVNDFFHPGTPPMAFVPLTWNDRAIIDGAPSPFDAGVAFATLEALQEVSRPGLDAAWRTFASSRRVAWKTGTSYGFRDAWAIGVTPSITVGVWVGNAGGEGRPGLTGHAAAAPLLFEIFEGLPQEAFFDQPEAAMRQVDLCRHSGLRAGPDCASATSVVPQACLPGKPCPYCRPVHLDPRRNLRVDATCQPVSAMRHQSTFILPPALARPYARRHPDYRPLPRWREDCRPESPEGRISCLYPDNGAEIYVPLELDGSRGRFVAEAVHADPGGTIFWHLDHRYLGRTEGEHHMPMAPEAGPHLLTLVDGGGSMLSRSFEVLRRPGDLVSRSSTPVGQFVH
ncbi:MAG: penicillin-binding protein 1C [Acidobacteriota bacterium]